MRLGADPEVFLVDSHGKHISAIGFINADKWNPLQIPGMPQGFTLQEDNVSLEYGIPPASSADEFVEHIQKVMEKSKEWLVSPSGETLSFSKLSCTIFDKDQMKHPLSQVFGCEPDYNAWTGLVNKSPKPPHEDMRSAGGHVHVETTRNPGEVVRLMDLFLSVPAVVMDRSGLARKKIGYGNAGAHRPKPYGVEYRPLANFWIFDEKYIRWVWRQTERALKSTLDVAAVGEYITLAINNNDKDMAEALINEYHLEVV